MRHGLPAFFSITFALLVFQDQAATAGDWPQILGVHRNGQAIGERLPERWKGTGPKTAWTMNVGEGFAGPAARDGRVIVFHRVERDERLDAFDALTGKSHWTRTFPASYPGGVNEDRGPRCVPTIAADRVVAFGAAGDLHCVSWTTGETVWSRSLYADYEGDLGYFGAGSSPLVIGDRILVNVGGRAAGIVALSLRDGTTVWQATKEGASYSSPIQVTRGDRTRVIFTTRLSTVMLDPEDGRVVSSIEFGRKGPTVNAATPLAFDDRLFLTASYGIGARMLRLVDDQLQPVWANDKSMSSQYATSVYHSGYLYGIHGREDADSAHLRCVDAQTGEIQWSEDNFGVANLILAADKLLVLKITGELILAKTSPKKFEVLAKSSIARSTFRALPALASGHLYVRTNEGRSSNVASKLIALTLE